MKYKHISLKDWSKFEDQSNNPYFFIVTAAEYQNEAPKTEWKIESLPCELNILRTDLPNFKATSYFLSKVFYKCH